MQSELELWLDRNPTIQGDVLVISGDLKPEVNIVSAEMFAQEVYDPEELINSNNFNPYYYLL